MVKQSDSHRLNLAGKTGHLAELVEVVPEPVGEWQDVDGANLLDVFYKDPQRYAYTFQSYVFVTRLLQARNPPFLSVRNSHLPGRFIREIHEM